MSIPEKRVSPKDLEILEMGLNYIDRHYREKISLEKLSLEIGLPEKKLQAALKLKFNLTLHQYLMQVRVERAKDLLVETNAPLKSIAVTTGFTDPSHLCRVFRRISDISPVEFRYNSAIV